MLDTTRWQKFLLKNICEIDMGTKLDFVNMTTEQPTVNFIGRSRYNNGVVGCVDLIPDLIPYPAGCLTIALGGSLGSTYLQTQDFYTAQNVSVLKFERKIPESAKLFLATIIMNECKYKYSAFGRELNVHIRKDFSVSLPAKRLRNGQAAPDWRKMQQMVLKYYNGPFQTSNINTLQPMDTQDWQAFRLGDLFEIKKGKRLTSEEQIDGYTPYIGAIDSDNGVAAHIGQLPIHEGNTISLSYNGSVGEAFYQPDPFWATDDVNVLYTKPKNGVIMNRFIGLFICTILRNEKYRYAYGRKWKMEYMLNTVIRLPATMNMEGEIIPDCNWMEKFMKKLPYSDVLVQKY